jgi:hypothetical protein
MTNPENNAKVDPTVMQMIYFLTMLSFAWPISTIFVLFRMAWNISSEVIDTYKSLK